MSRLLNLVPVNVYIVLLLILRIGLSYGYFITVDAHAEECFFDKVESGTKMGITCVSKKNRLV
jgi:hypothetical protein